MKKNFFDTEKTTGRKVRMVIPYDEQLDIRVEEFYKNIGDTAGARFDLLAVVYHNDLKPWYWN
jgi:hypothetical protein